MAYKQIKAKHREFPEGYWEERKIREYAKAYKGHIPFWKASKIATENKLDATEITHTEGKFVQYKNEKPAIVLRVEPKGVWLQEFDDKGEGIISDKTKSRVYFVPENDYAQHAEPFFFKFPFQIGGVLPFAYFK